MQMQKNQGGKRQTNKNYFDSGVGQGTMNAETIIVVAGKRKSAVAKVRVIEGNGSVTYNQLGKSALPFFHRVALEEPLAIALEVLGDIKFDFVITTAGVAKKAKLRLHVLQLPKRL